MEVTFVWFARNTEAKMVLMRIERNKDFIGAHSAGEKRRRADNSGKSGCGKMLTGPNTNGARPSSTSFQPQMPSTM